MRIFFCITLLVLSVFPCGKVFAGDAVPQFPDEINFSSNEEFRAGWESEENSRITGESVLRDLRSGKDSGLRLNALCSAESIAEVNLVRDKLLAIIERADNTAADESLLAARILERAAAVDITGLTKNDEKLIKKVSSLPAGCGPVKSAGFACGAIPSDAIAVHTAGAALNSTSGSFAFAANFAGRNIPGRFVSSIDPCKGFETIHADYYRLFLYMRDDTGDASCLRYIYPFPRHFTQLFNSSISFIQQNRLQNTEHNHKSESIPLCHTGFEEIKYRYLDETANIRCIPKIPVFPFRETGMTNACNLKFLHSPARSPLSKRGTRTSGDYLITLQFFNFTATVMEGFHEEA